MKVEKYVTDYNGDDIMLEHMYHAVFYYSDTVFPELKREIEETLYYVGL